MNVRPRFCGGAVLRIVLLALAVLLLCACQPAEVLTERVSRGDWSRGLQLGASSLAEAAPLSVSPVDGSLRIFWVAPPASGETAAAIHMAHLDAAGHVLSSGPLPLEVARPTDLRVEGAASGAMSLFWLDETSGQRTIWRASLSAEGDVVSASALMSTGVRALDTAPDPAGGVHVVWCADDAAASGLQYAHVSDGSGIASAPLNLGVGCLVPAVAVDATGLLHIVWTAEPDFGLRDIHYAALNPGADALTDATLLATLPVPTGQVLRDPALGISADGVTVFWALERRGGGLAPPSADSSRVFIPGGRAGEASPPQEVIVPPEREPAVIETESGFHLKWLAPATRDAGESEFVYYAAPLSTSGSELPVAFSAQLVGRTKSIQQIILTLWSAGEMTAYQVVAQTASTSLHPMLASDAANDLYVTWVDTAGFGAYKVYVAGTSDAMRSTLDRWRPLDVATAVLDFLWGVVQAAGFLPMAIVWLMPSLIVLAIYAVVRPDADLTQRGTRLMLLLAGMLYEATKIVIRPAWLTQFPVPSWVSPALTDRVILLAPLAIAALSGLLTALWARRRDYASLFPVYFVFAGCDVLLTLLVYVPAVLSE